MNPDDIFRFLLALGLLPVILLIGSGIRIPVGREAFVFGVVCIVVAFGMTAIGPLVPWTGFRLLRHFVFGIGGFSLALAAWQVRRYERAREAGEARSS